mmetsp:Transcript_3798/g.6383  ORF Transcript_3798/g.6383 Transcript_3798/m.6383 type:complete len:133 (-) Transcript_3798:1762-2160(-)
MPRACAGFQAAVSTAIKAKVAPQLNAIAWRHAWWIAARETLAHATVAIDVRQVDARGVVRFGGKPKKHAVGHLSGAFQLPKTNARACQGLQLSRRVARRLCPGRLGIQSGPSRVGSPLVAHVQRLVASALDR